MRPKCKILFQSWVIKKMRENSKLRERKGQEDIELGDNKIDNSEKEEKMEKILGIEKSKYMASEQSGGVHTFF